MTSVLFVTADDGYPTLARLASHFFREIQAFGLITASANMTEELAESYISERAGFTRTFLQTLETHCGLSFSVNTNLPFCYNTAEWNGSAPIAGYTQSTSIVLPSEVATSLTLNTMARAKKSLQYRLVKAALWQLAKTDLKTAINYLFDLHHAGFAGDDELFEVAAAFLSGRSQMGSDNALLVRALGRPAARVKDWLAIEPQTGWIDVGPLDADGKAILSGLLQRASQQIERVRDAEDLDAWIIGQNYIGGLLGIVRKLVALFIETPPLAWRALLSQWEEVEADAVGMMISARAGFNTLSPAISAQPVAHVFRHRIGDGWAERFYRERLLVPARLRQQLLFLEDLPVPGDWEHLSWRVIYPWSIAIKKDRQPLADRVNPPTADELLNLEAVRQVLRDAGISEPEQRRQVLTRYMGGDDGTLMTALRQVLPSDTNTLSAELLQADFEVLFRLNADARCADVAHQAREVISRYPYFPPAYLELAIALDRQDMPTLALEQLLAAITLSPHDAAAWQSLAVVLNRLGRWGEAQYATIFCAFLESQG